MNLTLDAAQAMIERARAHATSINVPDHGATWRYDAGSKQYFKTQDGSAFQNAGTGQVHARTVILEYVSSYLDTNPANTFHGYHTEAYELTGDGKADIYVDGVVIHATWHHPDPNVPAVYLDANGNPIELDNGLTWEGPLSGQPLLPNVNYGELQCFHPQVAATKTGVIGCAFYVYGPEAGRVVTTSML